MPFIPGITSENKIKFIENITLESKLNWRKIYNTRLKTSKNTFTVNLMKTLKALLKVKMIN